MEISFMLSGGGDVAALTGLVSIDEGRAVPDAGSSFLLISLALGGLGLVARVRRS